jgi:speckle targeted PIP5K1A-regulated poly(A) polymerase
MVTGLATPTSDLDVVVLTEWSPEDQFHFDENYYYFKTTTPSNDDPVPMDTESVTFTETQPPVTPTTDSTKVKICGSFDACDKDYKLILDMIASLPDLGDVLALPNARCPIIHFTHKQIKITCDLSINSRLGLYNTKLIKAYLDFDPRVPRLLHIIRAWARTINIKRTHLNNYALTLMLIYAMQRSTPPVLPSLQSPSFWPLNMEWIGKRGFTTATNSNDITVDGWMLQYNNPSSFMPSKNCMTLSQLLYHFFHFYSAVFPYEQQVVAIHISANSSLTIADACSLAARSAPSSLPAKLRSLKSGFFCVQDPIELSHNVTKSMNFSSLKCLKDEMSKAHTLISDMLENEQMEFKVNTVKFNLGIFKLFTACQNNDSTSVMIPKTPSKDCAILFFTLDKICKLLAKVPQFTDLSQSLYTYDKAYSFTLKCVVIQSLVFILENQLSFQCEAVPLGTEPANNDPVDDLSPVFVTNEEMVIINGQLPLMSVEGMNDRKRQRSNDENDSDEVDKNNDFKCNKLEDSICPLAHLLELSSSLKLHSYQCSAYCNTWTKIRQAKRLQARTGMTSSSMDSLSTHSPVLKFDVSCIEPDDVTGHYRKVWASNKDDYLVLISLKASEESMSEQFMTFFAYFKKLILL